MGLILKVLRGAIYTQHCMLVVKLTMGECGLGSLTLGKTRLGTFVIDIQTEDGIFENIQKVIRSFVSRSAFCFARENTGNFELD